MKRSLASLIILAGLFNAASAQLLLGVSQVNNNGSGSNPIGPTPSAIYNDGASQPLGSSGFQAFHDTGTNTTWYAWEGYQSVQGGNQRLEELATFNANTNAWSGNYSIGTLTLGSTDPHGIPVTCTDSSGRVYDFYGSHNSAVQINQIGTLSGGPLNPPFVLPPFGSAVTFPSCVSVGTNTLFLFYNTTGSGTGTQECMTLVKGTTSATGISWGSPQCLFDFVNLWAPIGQIVVNNGNINITLTQGSGGPGSAGQGLFFAILNPSTGTLSNYAGTHSDLTGAQPVSLTTANTNYRIYSGTDLYYSGLGFDSNNNPHICIPDASSAPGIIVCFDGASGSFTQTTVYTYTLNVTGLANDSNQIAVCPLTGTKVGVFFADGTQANGNSVAGNIREAVWSGGWAASAQAQASSGSDALDVPECPVNNVANQRAYWTQVTPDNVTISGALDGYVFADTGFLQRPSGYALLAGTGSTAFDPANTNSHVTLSSAFGSSNLTTTATANATNGFQARGTVSHTTGKFYFEVAKTDVISQGSFGIGLVTAAFNTTNDSNFMGGLGNTSAAYYGDGSFFINNTNVKSVASLVADTSHQYIGFAVDLTAQLVWLCVASGTTCAWNNDVIANQNPATDTGGISISGLGGVALFPAIEPDKTNTSAYTNFGQMPYFYGPPAGFANW